MKPFLKLQSVDEVLAMVREFPHLSDESVPLDEASGRFLAKDFLAPEDLPGFDRSTVDGYAVHARDVFGAQESSPALLECVGDCRMGETPDLVLQEGQTARILTGGMLPQGADAVVMVEYSRPINDTLVELTRSQAPGDHVLMHNEDAAQGQLLIPAGRQLRPQEIGLLAALGQMHVIVHKKPRVFIVSTGDEVVPATEKPHPGQVRDVNTHSLMALCRSAGAEAFFGGLIKDDFPKLQETVKQALEKADILLISGGSSAGMRDHTVEIFQSMPESRLLAHGVSLSPGKPFILAKSGEKCLMGLPGHVGSALVCARTFLLPLIRNLQGGEEELVPTIEATLTRSIASAQGRRDFIRVHLFKNEKGWQAEPILSPAGLMSGLVLANALVVCPENSEGLYAGQQVAAQILS